MRMPTSGVPTRQKQPDGGVRSRRSTNRSGTRVAREVVVVEMSQASSGHSSRSSARSSARMHVLLGCARRTKAIHHALPASGISAARRRRVPPRARPRRPRSSTTVPGVPSLRQPLAGQRRLAVAGRRDEREDADVRAVEKASQSGPLDDVAASSLSGFVSCHRPPRDHARRADSNPRAVISSSPCLRPGRRHGGRSPCFPKGCCERVVARRSAVRGRDLPASRHAELLAQRVAVRLRGPRRDAELRSRPPRSSSPRRSARRPAADAS